MKRFIFVLAALLFVFSQTAHSQSSLEGQDITEWKFHDEIVEGVTVGPDGTGIRVRPTGKSRSLIKVRGHFVREMIKSVEDI